MNDSDYINVYDTDADDPHHEINGWLRRNKLRQTEANISIFELELERIKEKIGLSTDQPLLWTCFDANVYLEVFEAFDI